MSKCFNDSGCWHKYVHYTYLENKLYSESNSAPAPLDSSSPVLLLTSNTDSAAAEVYCAPFLLTVVSHQPLALQLQKQNRDVKT